MKAAEPQAPAVVAVDFDTIPSHQSDTMCRVILGCVSRMFEDPAVKADYIRWQKERQTNQKKGAQHA